MHSTIKNTSSTLPRPYIGSCHNRNYISNPYSSTSLLTNYYFLNKPFLFQQNRRKNSFIYIQEELSSSPNQQLNYLDKRKNPFSTTSFLLPTYVDRVNIEETKRSNVSSSMTSKIHSYDQRISDQGNKYIIQLKTDDYQENEFQLTTHYSQNQLIIDAKHHEEDSSGGFIRRELHKIFLIPKHIDLNKYTHSYNKKTQELTIEMPYIHESNAHLTFSYGNVNLTNQTPLLPQTKPFDFDQFHRSAFRPQILSTSTDQNKLLMSLDLNDYQPEDIKISIKDQELIVKAEKQMQTDTKKSRSSFFQSTSLPPQTDIEHLQSNFFNGKLTIEAPYLDHKTSSNQQSTALNDDSYQQRTETMIEFVRLRRF